MLSTITLNNFQVMLVFIKTYFTFAIRNIVTKIKTKTKMKGKIKKFTIQRELKQKVSPGVIKAISKACNGYGNAKILAATAGVSFPTLNRIRKEKKATPTTESKIISALAELSEAA